MVDQLSRHEQALHVLVATAEAGDSSFTSAHAMAECYAALTALPLRRRVSPSEASDLIEENLVKRLKIVDLDSVCYRKVIRKVAMLGLPSGIIYDALHAECADQAKCERLYTFNGADFRRVCDSGITVCLP